MYPPDAFFGVIGSTLNCPLVETPPSSRTLNFGRRTVSTSTNVPHVQAQDVAQVSANLDFMPSASGSGHSFTVATLGSYQRTQPVSRGGLLLTTPGHGGEAIAWGANAALTHSNYFWFGVLSKSTLGVSTTTRSSTPFESLPEGSVRVGFWGICID